MNFMRATFGSGTVGQVVLPALLMIAKKETAHMSKDEDGNIVYLLTQLPFVGSWVCLGLLAVPAAVAAAVLFTIISVMMLAGFNPDFDEPGILLTIVLGGVMLILAIVTIFATLQWLTFLEDRAGVRLTFYWIPCVWLIWLAIFACGAFMVYMLIFVL
jgi:hypothetical protein